MLRESFARLSSWSSLYLIPIPKSWIPLSPASLGISAASPCRTWGISTRRDAATSGPSRFCAPYPIKKIQYANALDNLGSLEADCGQLKESKVLRLRAIELYGSAGDHAGVARSASSLAVVELAMGSRKEARHYLAYASREDAQVTTTSDPRNLAWMFGAECLLDEADGNFRAGMDQIDRVIDLWTQHYGSNYYLLASAYSIRG